MKDPHRCGTVGLTFLAVMIGLLAGGMPGLRAQTFTSLYKFTGAPTDGSEPLWMHLIQATDGDFYGTTEFGGVSNVGTVFKITSAGTPTILYQFKGTTVNDGAFPEAGLVQGSDGNFYGTTYEGGTNFEGTVFKMTPAGVLTNIHIFHNATNDGIAPFSPLTQGTDGYFYGTTSAGGARGAGTVFRIDSAGNYTNIWSFTNGPDGYNPYPGVFQGSDGYFYGTTQTSGSNNAGTVYKVSASGAFTVLHEFGDTPSDGQSPIGGIIQGYTGDYYGTTFSGGSNGYGVVFRMTSTGVLTNLYHFGGPANDGLNPRAGLTQGSDGYLYGTTYLGGTNGVGTLFKIGPSGGLVYLHDFDAFAGDGSYPAASPVEGYDGNYYGVTYMGGTNGGLGVVYKWSYPVPANPNEPNITDTGSPNGNNPNGTNTVIVGVASVAGETYQLQFANALPAAIWSNVPGGFVSNAIGGPLLFSNFVSSGVAQRFYRFEITP